VSEDKNVPWQNKNLMIAAVALAVVAVAINYWYITRIETKTEDQMIPVYRAKRTIEPGRMLTPDDIVEGEDIKIAAATEGDRKPYVPAGARGQFHSIKDLPARRRIDKGEPLRWDMFTEYTGGTNADEVTKFDYRQFFLEVDGRHSSGLIRPGSKVDLLGVLQLPGPDGNPLPPEAKMLLEQVDVIAVGNTWKPEDYRPGGGGSTKLAIHIPKEMVADLATIVKLIPPPIVVLRHPADTSTTTPAGIGARALEKFKQLAQSQKINPDRQLVVPSGF
jgi:hypothetical protein